MAFVLFVAIGVGAYALGNRAGTDAQEAPVSDVVTAQPNPSDGSGAAVATPATPTTAAATDQPKVASPIVPPAQPVVPPPAVSSSLTLATGRATVAIDRLYAAWSARDGVTIAGLVAPGVQPAFKPNFLDSVSGGIGVSTAANFDATESRLADDAVQVCERQRFVRNDGAI